MSYADGHAILTTIKRYIEYYQTIYDFPLLKYIIEPDFNLNYRFEDLKPLHSCYDYYKNKFETLETYNIVGSKKTLQTNYITEFIKKHCTLQDKIIHETCCGYSVLGETLLDKSQNTKLIGYDINNDLLIKNSKKLTIKNIKKL
jgi:hypothetical protein